MKRLLCIITIACVLFFNITPMYAFPINYSKEEDLKNNIEQAKAEYEIAKANYEEKLSEYNSKKAVIAQAEKDLENYKSENATAQATRNEKYTVWQAALANLNAKKSECQSKIDAYEQAVTEYNKGSIGFFEAMGSTDAINAIKNCKYASYTHVGDLKDATNLENMLESIRFIKQGNSCRLLEGVDPQNNNVLYELRITDYMMATAQANANYSVGIINHSGQFNVGENLAWGYSDPYKGWYTDEKALYQKGVRDFMQVGHYLNVVNSEYGITGFAKAIGGTYGYVHSQTFLWSGNEQSYSYNEYLERFLNYYNRVTSDKNNLKPEIDAINDVISSLEREVNQAENDYKVINGRVLELEQLITGAVSGLDNMKLLLSYIEYDLKILYNRMNDFKNIYDEYVLRYNELTKTSTYEVVEEIYLPDEIATEVSSESNSTEKTTSDGTVSDEISSEEASFEETVDGKNTKTSTKASSKTDNTNAETGVTTIGAKSEKNRPTNVLLPVAVGTVTVAGVLAVVLKLLKIKGIIK